MKNILTIAFVSFLISCGDHKNDRLTANNQILKQKIDSLINVNDSLSSLTTYICNSVLIDKRSDCTEHHYLKENRNENPLKGVFQISDTLELTHRNDKCGEWGGDIETIYVYKVIKYEPRFHVYEEKLMAYYMIQEYDCERTKLNPVKEIRTEPKELHLKHAVIAHDCIMDLLQHKLANDNLISNSGISNMVKLKDIDALTEGLTLIIEDYPSFEWKKFHLLKGVLKE